MIIIGKILTINTSDGILNLGVVDTNLQNFNIKIKSDCQVSIGEVYEFDCEVRQGERTSYFVLNYTKLNDFTLEKKNLALRAFYPTPAISFDDAKKEIDKYISKIENENINHIVKNLIKKYNNEFFIYPAASKLHHAYVGGLAYHTIGMLHLSDGFIENYPYLNKDYVYAGIILHDIGKTIELTGPINTEYSLKGQLLGHLVIGAMEVMEEANKLGISDSKEVLLLEHMLVSHHGQPQFGSAKKPMTAEALVLWYIDTIDSKFRVLGEELSKIESGEFTENIGVLDRQKIYKI